jgi:hypothetical protein
MHLRGWASASSLFVLFGEDKSAILPRQAFVLQISEVVNSMKDLISFERKTGLGPIGMYQCCLPTLDILLQQ